MTVFRELRTNRDLYLFVADLCQDRRSTARTLEEYLRTLWGLARADRARRALPLARFAELLGAALREAPPPFDAAWSRDYRVEPEALEGYACFEQTIQRQVVDLREMEEDGRLNDPQRYFGINAPRGPRWYNFDPKSFLECGVAGTFDGWESGDPTGRDYVPGPVAVMDENGKLTASDPRDLDRPPVELAEVTWEDFARFLESGQEYE